MMLLVQTPRGYEPERRYILGVVLSDWLGLPWRLEQQDRSDVRISISGAPDDRAVIVPEVLFGTDAPDWCTAASLPTASLPRIAVECRGPDQGRRLPVIYGAASSAPTALEMNGAHDARLQIDVFGSAFFMLTRYEEVVVRKRDQYGRFPAGSSLAGREGFLTSPIVDAYVEVLWVALENVWPYLRRRVRNYEVLLTHDVDDPLATLGRGPTDIARQFAADLVHRRDLGVAGKRARAILTARRGEHRSDPHNTFDFLMDVSERNGLSSAFFFQAHQSRNIGAGALYELGHPWIRGLLRRAHQRGHEIGYHAGFGTYLDPHRTAAEFDHLREVAAREGIDQDRWGGRQHYLQWAAPTTWQNWNGAGLAYDCTVAYADSVGFRTGTSHEFGVFDLAARRPLSLRERPFQVMDVTLFGYMSHSPTAAADLVARICGECRRYRGTVGILWHNDSVLRTAREKRWYADLIETVASST